MPLLAAIGIANLRLDDDSGAPPQRTSPVEPSYSYEYKIKVDSQDDDDGSESSGGLDDGGGQCEGGLDEEHEFLKESAQELVQFLDDESHFDCLPAAEEFDHFDPLSVAASPLVVVEPPAPLPNGLSPRPFAAAVPGKRPASPDECAVEAAGFHRAAAARCYPAGVHSVVYARLFEQRCAPLLRRQSALSAWSPTP